MLHYILNFLLQSLQNITHQPSVKIQLLNNSVHKQSVRYFTLDNENTKNNIIILRVSLYTTQHTVCHCIVKWLVPTWPYLYDWLIVATSTYNQVSYSNWNIKINAGAFCNDTLYVCTNSSSTLKASALTSNSSSEMFLVMDGSMTMLRKSNPGLAHLQST